MKTTFKLIIFLCGITGITAFSCNKEKNEDNYFPNQIGNNWTYSVYDSTSNKSEILKVSVSGNKNYAGAQSKIWLLTYNNRVDTFYVRSENDTIIITSNFAIKKIYIIPFSINQSWYELNVPTNKTNVIGIENITVEAGNFSDTYIITRSIRSLNYNLYEKINFKPKIGIIKLYSREYNMGPVQIKTWQLKNFNL